MGIYLLTIRKFSGPTTASELHDQETFNAARNDEMDKRGRDWRAIFLNIFFVKTGNHVILLRLWKRNSRFETQPKQVPMDAQKICFGFAITH
jgi:hypothetical protein